MPNPMWDQRYGAEGFLYGTEPNDFLGQRVGELPAGGEILSLGEGEGRRTGRLVMAP